MFELLGIIRFVYARFNDHQRVSSVKIEKHPLKYLALGYYLNLAF
jgi:hypothetical protein